MKEIKTPEKITYYQGGKWYESTRADYEATRIAREEGIPLLCTESSEDKPQ